MRLSDRFVLRNRPSNHGTSQAIQVLDVQIPTNPRTTLNDAADTLSDLMPLPSSESAVVKCGRPEDVTWLLDCVFRVLIYAVYRRSLQ